MFLLLRNSLSQKFIKPKFLLNSSIRGFAAETVLSFKEVSFEYVPNKLILNEANFNIREGAKVTIMGQNGSGKSTILKLMNGHLKAKKGSINIKGKYALSTAKQVISPEDREKTVYDFFLSQLHGNSSGIHSRIANVLQKVELEAPHDRLVKTFSGGQQARLLLASALILEPDIILLDEPTNNLDVKGIDLLRKIIKGLEQTCVVISHDEDFLNSFTDSVLYLDNFSKKVEYYDGDYNLVKKEISNRIAKEQQTNARLEREAQKKKETANMFANKGGNMRKQAKKLKLEAQDLEESTINVRKEDRSLAPFEIPVQDPSTGVGANILKVPYINLPCGKVLDFEHNPWVLEKGNHVRIIGPNGIGKTTFLESLVKRKAPGITLNNLANIGYYRQDFHNLDFDSTVIDTLHKASDGKHEEFEIRSLAARLLLRGDLMKQKVKTLSEGQKGLLSLACICLTEPALLIMDEPTNHINFRHLPIIAKALNEYEGALIIVTHDQEFASSLDITAEIDLGDAV